MLYHINHGNLQASNPIQMSTASFQSHDHALCISDAMAAADAYCASRKLQFTKVRRRVLEIMLMEHKAMGAYDILAVLAKEDLGSQPPVAYRALDFLVGNGFAHKIEKLNAYVACSLPGAVHSPAFMICRKCNAVLEAKSPLTRGMFGNAARDANFKIESTVVEAEGLCPLCQDQPKTGTDI